MHDWPFLRVESSQLGKQGGAWGEVMHVAQAGDRCGDQLWQAVLKKLILKKKKSRGVKDEKVDLVQKWLETTTTSLNVVEK